MENKSAYISAVIGAISQVVVVPALGLMSKHLGEPGMLIAATYTATIVAIVSSLVLAKRHAILGYGIALGFIWLMIADLARDLFESQLSDGPFRALVFRWEISVTILAFLIWPKIRAHR